MAAETGISVPAELPLLAWDDSQLCRLTRPALPAMSHDVHGFGAQVAHALFEVIAGQEAVSRPVDTPVAGPARLYGAAEGMCDAGPRTVVRTSVRGPAASVLSPPRG